MKCLCAYLAMAEGAAGRTQRHYGQPQTHIQYTKNREAKKSRHWSNSGYIVGGASKQVEGEERERERERERWHRFVNKTVTHWGDHKITRVKVSYYIATIEPAS